MDQQLLITLGLLLVLSMAAIGLVYFGFRNFYVAVDPDEFVVHYRRGKVIHSGRGLSFFCFPYDTFLKVRSTIRDINFCADQITKEKQGVRVQGFLAYKVADFDVAYQCLDLKARSMKVLSQCSDNIEVTDYDAKNQECVINLDPTDPLAKTDLVLRRLAESVVRHEVSNKTVDEMISERESVIQSMKTQMQATVRDWGLEIDTIEFTEVWIRSRELFESLQAEYRNEMRMKAANSNAVTDRSIAERRIESEREIATMEAQNERLRRVTESEERRAARETEIANQSEVVRLETEEEARARRQRLEMARELEEKEKLKEYALRQQELELKQKEELARIQGGIAEQQESHRLEVDRREKARLIRESELESARKLQEMTKLKEIEAAELERQKAEVEARAELEHKQAWATQRQVETEARAREIEILAKAELEKAQRVAEAVLERGKADAESLRLQIEAENAIQPGQLQKLFVKELPRIAESMRVKDVRWVNLASGGPGGEDPMGMVPRTIANLMGVFQGMGLNLDGLVGSPTNDGPTNTLEPEIDPAGAPTVVDQEPSN
jgi:regulator of protease activity HflC (stomatin/prohibitin superfamily)